MAPVSSGRERILGEADAIFVSSEAERDIVDDLYATSPRRLRSSPAGATSSSSRPATARTCGTPATYRRHGRSCSSSEGSKSGRGTGPSSKIARELRDDPRLSFVVVGGREGMDYEDAGRAAVLGWLEREGLDNIHILPAVPHGAVPDVLRSAMCIVLPSAYEPFGLTALEAQACGCVPIAADTGGLTATIDSGRTGFLLPADAKQMALAVERLADDPAAHEEMRARSVAWVREHFSWDAPRSPLRRGVGGMLSAGELRDWDAVVPMRAQPLHFGHLRLVRNMAALFRSVRVVVGNQPASSRIRSRSASAGGGCRSPSTSTGCAASTSYAARTASPPARESVST